jgi:hypothetical protein
MLADLDPTHYRPHDLHDSARHWPQTNCWTDLWIEVVASIGAEPRAMLGFTLTQDYEGDQATFFKVPSEDLETLFGLRLQELSIFDRFETHVVEQVARKRLVVAEVDGFHLPDTAGVSYRSTHPKTTIGIARIDPAARRIAYFHNQGFFSLEGEDYDGIFRDAHAGTDLARQFPYSEFLKLPERLPTIDLTSAALGLLHRHMARRPAANPFRAWSEDFPRHAADLATRPQAYFHTYAFNLPRQFGANFELLGTHLEWLTTVGEPGLDVAAQSAKDIASTAKVFQFKLARAMARGSFDGLVPLIDAMAGLYDHTMDTLTAHLEPKARMNVAA